ncbi:MAG: penicillin-binding protein 2 [Oligoflexales bacterium]|nr:penicillin-binding protein 2 [Oligoflexales bacterium]
MIHLFPSSLEHLQEIANKQYHKDLDLAPYRGTIFDRRNIPLAISIKKSSLFINPRLFKPTSEEYRQLSELLQMSIFKIKMIQERKNYFAWLKRKIPKETANKITKMKIKGLFEVQEPDRVYPQGSSGAHIIGYVGLDNMGLLGLERKFDSELRGPTIKIQRSQDARGESIFLQSDYAVPEKTGNNLFLTVDNAIQEIAEKALSEGIKNANAKGGFAIVSDPHTGRIIAMANYPKFDPNQMKKFELEPTRNRALSDTFEPGSVIKPFVIGEALARGKIKLTDMLDCERGLFHGHSWKIRDAHPYDILSAKDVLIHSSNIGTYKIAEKLGPKKLYDALVNFGFSTKTSQIDFPGQSFGRIDPYETWKPVRFANIAFGQGFVTTGLEIVSAYGAIANGGNLMKPYLVDHIESSERQMIASNTSRIERRVFSPQLAKELRIILHEVVERGTGKLARMDQYTAAGKTGTTEKVDPLTKAYSTDKRIASFAGFTPVNDPHLVIYVVIDEPGKKPYYGGIWAAPVFKEIALGSLRYLNVAPDKAQKTGVGLTISKGELDSPDAPVYD